MSDYISKTFKITSSNYSTEVRIFYELRITIFPSCLLRAPSCNSFFEFEIWNLFSFVNLRVSFVHLRVTAL